MSGVEPRLRGVAHRQALLRKIHAGAASPKHYGRADAPRACSTAIAVRKALVPPPSATTSVRAKISIRRWRNLPSLLADQGLVVLVPATAHRERFREYARRIARRFIEVYVETPVSEVERRDSKGLYEAARSVDGSSEVPGADVPYEPPLAADVRARGGKDPAAVDRNVASV